MPSCFTISVTGTKPFFACTKATAPSSVFIRLGISFLRSAVINRVYIEPNGTVSNLTVTPGCCAAHALACFWMMLACAAVVRFDQTLSSCA